MTRGGSLHSRNGSKESVSSDAEGRVTVPPRSGVGKRRRSLAVPQRGRIERARALHRALELEQASEDRPRTRADCEHGVRPCPFVACKHHLYLDVSPNTGTIKLNFPELEVWELAETCALDVASNGAQGFDRTGMLLNVTRERVRQIEAQALSKLIGQPRLRDFAGVEPKPSKR